MPFQSSSVGDGEAALAYLQGEGAFRDAARPDLVLLDLNLPKIDGRDVLQFIRSHPALHELPVIILSSSPQDAMGELAVEATCYIQKPPDLDNYLKIGSLIRDCWQTATAQAR